MEVQQIKFKSFEEVDPIEFINDIYKNSKTRELRPLQFYARNQMGNEVHFYDLSANTAFKCDTMLPNKTQCLSRAVVSIVPDRDADELNHSHLCRHHFTLERALNEKEGMKYIYHDSNGKVASDVDKEYKPAQK